MTAVAAPGLWTPRSPRITLPRLWTPRRDRALSDQVAAAIGTPASLGNGSANSGTTITVTNSANATAGRVFVVIWIASPTAPTVSASGGGASGWASSLVAPITGLNGDSYVLSIWSSDAPSGTTGSITVTSTSTIDAGAAIAFYCTGLATSSVLDNSGGTSDNTSGGSWSSGAVAMSNANDLLIGVSGSDNFGAQTSAVTSPWTEIGQLHTAQDFNLQVSYQIVSSAASYTASGTWTAGPFSEAALIAGYKAAAGGGATTAPPPQRRRFPLALLIR